MSQESKKRWIVVLDKVPRGPLTEEEVIALLDQGILRHNDMGFEVAPDGEKLSREDSQWKLLWQFPQFDRRDRDEEEGGENPPPPERRHSRGGTTLPPETDLPEPMSPADLPPEALDFDPEQLVLGKKESHSSEMFSDEGGLSGPVQYAGSEESDRTKLWLGMSVGFVLTSVVLFAWLGSSPAPTQRQARSVEAPIEQAQPQARKPRRSRTRRARPTQPRPRRLPARTVTPTAPPPPPPAVENRPAPRDRLPADLEDEEEADRGEILDDMGDEYRDEELSRPRLRRPRRRPDRAPYEDELPPDDRYDDYPPDTPPEELLEEDAWQDEEY